MRFFHETDEGPKPFALPQPVCTTASVSLMWRILDGALHNANPIAVWGRQYGWRRFAAQAERHEIRPSQDGLLPLDLEYSLSGIQHLYWYMEHARLDDLDLRILSEFRKAARTGSQPEPTIVGHLPSGRMDEIMEGLCFEPVITQNGRGRGGKSVGLVPVALMFHAARLGVSPKATREMFAHDIPMSAVSAMRRYFLRYYQPVYPEWKWSQNENSAQRALLRPQRPRVF